MTAFLFAVLCLSAGGCIPKDDGPQTGPGLEPPVPIGMAHDSDDLGQFGNVGAAPSLPTSGLNGVPAAAGSAAETPPRTPPQSDPSSDSDGTGAAGTSGAGMMAGGAAGTAGAASAEPPTTTGDAGMPCESERLPALGDNTPRVIAPWLDGGIFSQAACTYELPQEAATYLPDNVNLEHTVEDQTQTVPRVAGMEACDPIEGGFYYDDPQNPSAIVACAASCTRFRQGGDVMIVLGCPTVTR